MRADLLVEIGTEELPSKSLEPLRAAFETAVCAGLERQRIACGQSRGRLAGPRRLALLIRDVAAQQPDRDERLLGPSVAVAFDAAGNPTAAAQGFARKVGVAVTDLQQIDDPGNSSKGARLAYLRRIPGGATAALLPAIVQSALESLPIAKRMRWGAGRAEFVRPIHWALILFGSQPVAGEVFGVPIGRVSRGHRFHAPGEIAVPAAAGYPALLRSAGKVEPDLARRREQIRRAVEDLAQTELGGRAVIDAELLDEVAALVEWPVALAGRFDRRFLSVPAEALICAMREHQKCFHAVDDKGALLPGFIGVANIESRQPQRVVGGNERVMRSRLADAAFFYEADKKTAFADFRERLKAVIFQESLGSVYAKSERVAALAAQIAPLVGADPEVAARAGGLCKCDLVSQMVLEFAQLQGVMGRHYALASGEAAAVAEAIGEHYLPRFAGDRLPQTAVGTALALADRLDSLTGLFGIGQPPSGSRDPFALRRASLSVLRLLVEGGHALSLRDLIERASALHSGLTEPAAALTERLLDYILERFAAWFAERGVAAEAFLAVRALGLDDPAEIHARTLAVAEFAASAEAKALAQLNKRVANILEKSAGAEPQAVDPALFVADEERQLWAAVTQMAEALAPLLQAGQHAAALKLLLGLHAPIDAFFAHVMVNVEDKKVRANRLGLLRELRGLFLSVADISALAPAADSD